MLPAGQDRMPTNLRPLWISAPWVHAEWVPPPSFRQWKRRTARLWADCLAMRYGLPPFYPFAPQAEPRLRGGREGDAMRLVANRHLLSATAVRFFQRGLDHETLIRRRRRIPPLYDRVVTVRVTKPMKVLRLAGSQGAPAGHIKSSSIASPLRLFA
jgi:hypothetical protein